MKRQRRVGLPFFHVLPHNLELAVKDMGLLIVFRNDFPSLA